MAKSNYVPRSDKDKVIWLNNFASKFAQVSTGLGFVAADVTSINNDAVMFSYLINQVEVYTTAKEQRVDYKNLIKDGPLGKPGGPLPVAPVAGTVPTAVLPGIFARIAQLVPRIKNSPTYTDAIGKDLGIIGAEQPFDPSLMKPVLKLAMLGGQVEVQWAKGEADAIRIETDKGSGWQFLSIDTVPHYTDTTPITAPAVWKYRAMYLVADELVGHWSDVATITVS